jgi:hypothetical protein
MFMRHRTGGIGGFAWISALHFALLSGPAAETTEDWVASIVSVDPSPPVSAEVLRRRRDWDTPTLWAPAVTNLPYGRLFRGNWVRVLDREITLKWNDGTEVRLGKGAVVGIPTEPGIFATIKEGIAYFFNRGQPGLIEIEGIAFLTIRGTEFVVEVPATNNLTVSVLDGAVSIKADRDVTIRKNQTASVKDKKVSDPRAIEPKNVIQWLLYYPAMVDPRDLELERNTNTALRSSIAAYLEGNVVRAYQLFPYDKPPPLSPAERVYSAALALAAGQIELCLTNLIEVEKSSDERVQGVASALRQLIATVQGQALARTNAIRWSSEWIAESYYQQSLAGRTNDPPYTPFEEDAYGKRRHRDQRLRNALRAAEEAARAAPDWPFAQVRLAELHMSFGNIAAADDALDPVLKRGYSHAQAFAAGGFISAAKLDWAAARHRFTRATELDGRLGNGWLGLGLLSVRDGRMDEAVQFFMRAAAAEPQRSIFRAYLGKANYEAATYVAHPLESLRRILGVTRDDPWQLTLSLKELGLARKLDANDPTAPLYAALIYHQQYRINEAVQELEQSKDLTKNRRLYRSAHLLDQDQAVRSANLAAIYRDAGMTEWSVREASRAVNLDYANSTAHLFLANSYNQLRDPRQVNLRYETPWLGEFFLAELLAPVGANSFSPLISEQEYSRLFQRDVLGFNAAAEYQSSGDWRVYGSQYGIANRTAYSVDAYHSKQAGWRDNEDVETLTIWGRMKEQITSQDSISAQLIYYNSEAGDVAQRLDQSLINPTLRVHEKQEPLATLGYHRQWDAQRHTLVLGSLLSDVLQVDDQQSPVLLYGRDATNTIRITPENVGFASNSYENRWRVYSIALQQIWSRASDTLILGSRLQRGDFKTTSSLGESTDITIRGFETRTVEFNQDTYADFGRFTLYGYEQWYISDDFTLIGGLTYDRLTYPENFRQPPVSDEDRTVEEISPKAGFIWSPRAETTLRGAYARSLGGVSFDQSFRLEPVQVAGFDQAFRSLASESVVGSSSGAEMEVWGLGLEQKFDHQTFFSIKGELLRSSQDDGLGVFVFPRQNFFTPQEPAVISRLAEYEEKNLVITLNKLLCEEWSLGAEYRLSDARLRVNYPDLPRGTEPEESFHEALLQQPRAFALYRHRSGAFAGFDAWWIWQTSHAGAEKDAEAQDSFWRLDLYGGWRFPQGRGEIRLGLLNLADADYRLNPLTPHLEHPRGRVMTVGLRLNL